MSDFRLLRAILEHSWEKARTLVAEHPHLVYVGSFSRCDYIHLNNNNDDDNSNDDNDDDSSNGLLQRRGALHELCRICDALNEEEDDSEVDESSSRHFMAEKQQILQLATDMIRASHGANNRHEWEQPKQEYCFERSILLLYEGDQTPLHILLSRNVDMQMIAVLLESITLERSRATIQVPTVLELLTNQNSLGVTPLHYLANCRSCPVPHLRRILQYAAEEQQSTISSSSSLMEEAMCMQDIDDFENPMHWAMSSPVSPKQFGILLEYGGAKALWRLNLGGEFPLHVFANACQSDLLLCDEDEVVATEANNLRAFEEFLKVAMEHLCHPKEEDSMDDKQTRWLPLHHMVSSICFPCPGYMLNIAQREYCSENDAITQYDDNGLLPLHLALLAPRQSTWRAMLSGEAAKQAATNNNKIICKLLEQSERSSHMVSRKDGRLPLHYAVEANLELGTILELVGKYPGALSLPDPVTGLHPFALAAVKDNACLDVLFELGRLCPTVLES
ncbi:expressed unknown protein [Seminavis robusta]|uniref:Uncharacterized protein n=1 Tax=Seminavis robusta TaxID=568900 RepID=A0A9N8DCG2_9STRA|nr:expressed unknown protein [Seminavis robusta]|eukprot:Sro83_g044560.1 n/a (505) ;mRNA; r:114936-116603